MTLKHTPGPWSYGASAGNHDYLIYSETRQNALAYVRDFNKPNASLISSAPDLLAALQWALDDPDSEILGTEWAKAARQAITKATGE